MLLALFYCSHIQTLTNIVLIISTIQATADTLKTEKDLVTLFTTNSESCLTLLTISFLYYLDSPSWYCYNLRFSPSITQHQNENLRLSPRALVRLCWRHLCPYTCRLSSWSSSSALTSFTCEGTYLEDGFPLRCFQRLSSPDLATQRCTWQHNWHTRGLSTPVLSY